MYCTACSGGIERAVKKLDGVSFAEVSLMAEEMVVEYDQNLLNEQTIINTVKKLGYKIKKDDGKALDKNDVVRNMKFRFFTSLLLLLPLSWLAMGEMVGLPVPQNQNVSFIIQAVLSLSIMTINGKFFVNGVKAVLNLSPNMDTLISLGSGASFIYSAVAMIFCFLGKSHNHHLFFDSAATVLTLVTLGKWLEELSKKKTGSEIDKLSKMMSDQVIIFIDGEETVVETSKLKVGDVVCLKSGDYCPVDGKVVYGQATADCSAVTGESVPVELTDNSELTSGAVIKTGYVRLQAEKVGGDTMFSHIIEAVKAAGASKAPIQKLADKISGVFVPVVTAISVITFIVWILISKDAYDSFNYAISVLVVSCPCSLGLATPVAVMAAMGKSAHHGILFKDAKALQFFNKVDCILFDKTATITNGTPEVVECATAYDKKEIMPVCYALEAMSNHPLADCVKNYCRPYRLPVTVDEYDYVVGKGIIGKVNGKNYYVGNLSIIPDNVAEKTSTEPTSDRTEIFFADDENLLATFYVADSIKETSEKAIEELSLRDIKTVMVTGDKENVAKAVAEKVGIAEYKCEVLPEGKSEIVKEYKNKGYNVAMVGDGINDSVALKEADVGIAVGTGTDIAIDSAEVVLTDGNLDKIPVAADISKKALKIIKGNLFWAFIYNVISIPVAAGAFSFFGLVLTPTICAASMSLSSLFVVLNALRLTVFNPKKQTRRI